MSDHSGKVIPDEFVYEPRAVVKKETLVSCMDYFVTITAFSQDGTQLASETQQLPIVSAPEYDGFTGENVTLETNSISWKHDLCVDKYFVTVSDPEGNEPVNSREVDVQSKMFKRFFL